MIRRMSALGLVVLCAAACARSPLPRPQSPESEPPDPARVPVYEGVLRHLAGADLGGRWRHVYVASPICPGAGGAEDRRPCTDAFSASEQSQLTRRLRDLHGDVRFVPADRVRPLVRGIFDGEPAGGLAVRGAVLLRVGSIVDEGAGRVSVPGSYYCGGLCAGGATWLLRWTGDAWEVAGPKDGEWIS